MRNGVNVSTTVRTSAGDWKIIGTALAICLTAIGLSACSSGEGSSQVSASAKQTITFWDNNGGPGRTPLYTHLIAEFEKANPSITVKYSGLPNVVANGSGASGLRFNGDKESRLPSNSGFSKHSASVPLFSA